MKRCILTLTVAAALAATAARGADDQKDASKLEGTWVATSYQRGEGKIGKDKVATELVITKDGYQFPKGINRISKTGTFKADPAKGTIDFTPADGPAQGKTLLGIYKVEGDKLTLCFRSAGRDRPAELKSTDRATVLATYERKK
jgi:uncharacterized protein (TIGR03067 family)